MGCVEIAAAICGPPSSINTATRNGYTLSAKRTETLSGHQWNTRDHGAALPVLSSKKKCSAPTAGPMPKLSQNWSVPFSRRAVLCWRYGQLSGPGTYNEQQPPKEPRVHIDRAADRTVEALGEPTGIVVITD